MMRILIDNWWLFLCRAVFAWLFAAYRWFVQGAKLPFLLRAFAMRQPFGLLAFGAADGWTGM